MISDGQTDGTGNNTPHAKHLPRGKMCDYQTDQLTNVCYISPLSFQRAITTTQVAITICVDYLGLPGCRCSSDGKLYITVHATEDDLLVLCQLNFLQTQEGHFTQLLAHAGIKHHYITVTTELGLGLDE